MNLCGLISNIHWLPVIVMTLFSFILGALWHQHFLFGKTWLAENKLTDPKSQLNIPLIFGGTAVLHFLALAALSAVVSEQGGANGFIVGLLIALVWISSSLGSTYLFAGRSLKLLAIDAGMYIVLFSVSGWIMGIW
ncbi:MAG: DUF1761 domain-containing protein [Candidatus Saccharibacteria bacterium]